MLPKPELPVIPSPPLPAPAQMAYRLQLKPSIHSRIYFKSWLQFDAVSHFKSDGIAAGRHAVGSNSPGSRVAAALIDSRYMEMLRTGFPAIMHSRFEVATNHIPRSVLHLEAVVRNILFCRTISMVRHNRGTAANLASVI